MLLLKIITSSIWFKVSQNRVTVSSAFVLMLEFVVTSGCLKRQLLNK